MDVRHLPVKSGPETGDRSFNDNEEALIYYFVEIDRGTPEWAAVLTRVTYGGIRKILTRVKKRIEETGTIAVHFPGGERIMLNKDGAC